MNSIPDKNIMCHRTGFQKSCKEIVVEGQCRLWMQLRGMDNNTGEQVDKFGCADEFLPLLLIENSNLQRQTGAAVESFRNQYTKIKSVELQYNSPILLENN